MRTGRPAPSSTAYTAYGGATASIPSSSAYGASYGADSYASQTSSSSYPSASTSSTGVGYGGGYGNGGYSSNSAPAYHGEEGMFKDKPLNSSRSNSFLKLVKLYAMEPSAWATVVAVLFFTLTIHYRGQRNSILRSFEVPSARNLFDIYLDRSGKPKPCDEYLTSSRQNHAENHELRSRITTLEDELKILEREKKQLKKRKSEEHEDAIEHLSTRDFAWKEQVQVLQNATQREAKRAATELFGPGPHHVKFSVILPSDDDERERHFTVEMAPLDVMPHSVHFFLQQVVHGLWNDAWFYLNGPHVLQGGPQAEEDEEDLWHLEHQEDDDRAVAMKQFRELDLENLAFPEYSEKYPHVQWTLGFTGRPGGPDFYINKIDNRATHGPGGQHQHDLEEYGDPCFAKVVDGFDVLNQMFKEPTYGDDHEWGWFFKDPVHIVKAKMMENAPLKIEVAPTSEEHTAKPEKPLKKPRIENQVDP